MPLPRIWLRCSPVATQIVSGWSWQIAIPPIDGDAEFGHVVDHVSPPSLDCQTPPDARPA